MKLNKGLTLIEMLVALAVSSFVILGTYALFKATTDIRILFYDKSEQTAIQTSLVLMVNRDLNAATGSEAELSDFSTGETLSFVTHNSLVFNGAIPVTVTYALEDGYLVREELNSRVDYRQVMRLVSNVKKFDILYFDGSDYVESPVNLKTVKIETDVEGYQFNIIAGKFVYE